MNTRLAVAAALLLTAGSYLAAQNQVLVASSGELVQALASNRTILLAPGRYLVSEAAQTGNPAVSWEETFDGPQLVITGLSNFTLRARRGATLLASPRYAFTLVFVDCRNLVLEGLALGHTEQGECVGGVLYMDACEGVRIQDCDLFGSGVVGLEAVDSSGITIRASTIRDCSGGAFWATRVRDLRLDNTLISGNGSYPLISLDSSWTVVLESCRIERNTGDLLLQIEGDSGKIALPGSEIRYNETNSLYEGSFSPDLSQARVAENAFDLPVDEEGYEEEYEEEYDEQ
jgi:polygalacturonase